MSDDSFIREVDEELRSDRVQDFWNRYKWFVIAIAVAIIAGTGGYNYWNAYSQRVAGDSGDRFLEAVTLSDQGEHARAIEILESLGIDGAGEYPALARIRLAAEFARQGDTEQAIQSFDEIASDTGFDETLRSVARLRAGLLLVDHGSYADVVERLEEMAGTGQAFRHSAREGLGLSAWKHRNLEDAYRWFSAVTQDIQAPGGVRNRAGVMLQLLAGRGVTGSEQN